METGLRMSFTQQLGVLGFALFFLLQLHLLLALPHQRSLFAADLLNEEKEATIVPKKLAVSVNHHEIKGIIRHGGGHGAIGGAHGNGGYVAGDNGGGGGSDDHGQGGAVIPLYAAAATNHNRDHRHHGSSGGTIRHIGSSCLALILLTSFILAY